VPAKTKTLTIRGTKYTIRRWTAEVADDANKSIKENNKFHVVMLGTVSPKFASEEAVKQEDWETVEHLYLDIVQFNQMEPAFLSRLKNLPQLESPQLPTQES
jgi:hypothetical protein